MWRNIVDSLTMGKDQELLDASRTGNTEVVERILANHRKKTGPLGPFAR